MSLARRLDPRFHLAAAAGWIVFAVGTGAALVGGSLAGDIAERHVRADTERLLGQFADQVGRELAAHLSTRLAVVEATAAQIAAPVGHDRTALERHLDSVQRHFREFAWLGVVDPSGRVLARTGGAGHSRDGAVDDSVPVGVPAAEPWLGDVAEAGPDATRPGDSPPDRLVVASAPVLGPGGQLTGRVVGRLSWQWIGELASGMVRGVAGGRSLDLLVLARDGTVLVAPVHWKVSGAGAARDYSEHGRYLVSRDVARAPGVDAGPGWTVVIREPAAEALADAIDVRRIVYFVVLAAGVLSALGAVVIVQRLLRRLERLARGADQIREGTRTGLAVPAGRDEVSRIGAALSSLVTQLQGEKAALATLNAELDDKVVQRTKRIERLAEEAKHAAVVRERLRMARDLHDTLAHSLMALLTQIRLVRKMHGRLDAAGLDAELAQAEAVAASGLEDARAVITQMRHNSVGDIGLGGALRELLARFEERTGVAARVTVDPAAGALADTRAETVFRIVEEALSNVERHADAQTVTVDLKWLAADATPEPGASPGRVRLEVRDDGVGFDTSVPRPGHYGLLGIAEQAALVDATLEIDSCPGAGTRVALEFPA